MSKAIKYAGKTWSSNIYNIYLYLHILFRLLIKGFRDFTGYRCLQPGKADRMQYKKKKTAFDLLFSLPLWHLLHHSGPAPFLLPYSFACFVGICRLALSCRCRQLLIAGSSHAPCAPLWCPAVCVNWLHPEMRSRIRAQTTRIKEARQRGHYRSLPAAMSKGCQLHAECSAEKCLLISV